MVDNAFARFEPWLESSGMPFFPGFTDHSPRHINDVLKTAASLVSDKARSLLTSEDVAVLCLAILLHDCGMHLTQDSFRGLIADDSEVFCKGLDSKSWAATWREFASDASRFSEEKWMAILGTSSPVDVPRLALDNLSETGLLVAGEFVRRHHARLAHEIALRGVPPFSKDSIRIDGDLEYLDIAGMIARSHNMDLRHATQHFSEQYQSRQYRGVHAPFLMGLLRIADYIQVQSERANANLLKVKELRSSISISEWKAHFAVREVSVNHQDPEALFVNALPQDAATFVKVDALFRDIQRELDTTWAVLGETYGRFDDMSGLGLTIRRIRSTLDDLPKLSKRLPYLPVHARFRSSDAKLLPLLVGPLYDYDVTIGVRELIQNAVDACRERGNVQADWRTRDQAKHSVDVDVLLGESMGRAVRRTVRAHIAGIDASKRPRIGETWYHYIVHGSRINSRAPHCGTRRIAA